jgi:hypothetical protein
VFDKAVDNVHSIQHVKCRVVIRRDIMGVQSRGKQLHSRFYEKPFSVTRAEK